MSLPICSLPPDQAQYAAAYGETSVSTKLAGGASRFRNDELGAAFDVDVQWTMNAANFDLLTAFYRTAVNYGADPFQIDLMLDSSAMQTYTAHFFPFTFRLIEQMGETYVVAAKLEIVPDPTYAAGDAALLAAAGVVVPVPPPPPTGGGTGTVITPPTPPPNSVSAYAVVSNVVTITGVFPTPYPAGRSVLIAGTGSFLDGAVLNVITSSGTTFTANYTHANASASGLTGTATLQPVHTPTLDDMIDWHLLAYPDRLTMHVTGSGVNAYGWKDADGQKLHLIKSPTGWASDMRYYDSKYLYKYITENGDHNNPGHIGVDYWSDPHAFKRHFPVLPYMPRFFDVNGPKVTIVNPGSNSFIRTINDETDGQPLINLGPVTDVTNPQVLRSYGGDVGTAMSVRYQFYYGKQKEEFDFVKNVGLVQWIHFALTSGPKITGVYTQDVATKLHNLIVSGGCPAPVFPAYNVIPGNGFPGGWLGGVPGAGANIP